MTKPKLYYAYITRTHTHCYINSSTQYKGMYTSCSYHSLFVRQWIYKHHFPRMFSGKLYHVFNIKRLSVQSRQSFFFLSFLAGARAGCVSAWIRAWCVLMVLKQHIKPSQLCCLCHETILPVSDLSVGLAVCSLVPLNLKDLHPRCRSC